MSTSSITPRILLVDDNPKNLQILISYLKNFQFHLDISTSGEDAFSSIATSKPDLILLDIMMPDMDGYEVCRRLKADPLTADIPIIFITALAEPENKIKGFQLGGVDYITKPFHKQEVMARIETQLTMIRQRQELLDLNIKLQSSNKMLEEANEAKDKLLTIIGHDLRGPIGNINNLLHLILENQLDGNDRNELLQETILSVQGTYFLLENLLFWAKSQRNEIEFYPEEVNLNELIVETIHSLQSTAVDKNIVVSSHLDDTDTVTGDSNMLAVVIRNLISNA
ncbi:MAG: hybrid sensor histidine kinase/response regulator, partial [Bacteroidetes bacterium HGW-Bacteroidetes-22]